MTQPKDDLAGWDDPIVRALRAPGSPAELVGEREILTAYRASRPTRGRLRLVSRLGASGSVALAVVALSGGVAAAAYTQTLPDPIQRIAHRMLAPIGVPAAPTDPEPGVTAAAAPPKSAPATASSGPTPSAPHATAHAAAARHPSTHPAHHHSGAPGPTTAPTKAPAVAPASPRPVTTPPKTTAPVAPRPRPANVSASASARRVVVGGTVAVSGVVTDGNGRPLSGRPVVLLGHQPGHPGWTRLASGSTDRTGSVVLTPGPLHENTGLRLRTRHQVHSASTRVVVVPTVSATPRSEDVTVRTDGGTPGDSVLLYRVRRGQRIRLAHAVLDTSGATSFSVPTARRSVRFVVVLSKTPQHARAATGFRVAGSGPGSAH